jgi:hypothetical protein
MDVIDRYFQRLRLFLPNYQRNDIIRELSEEIRAQATHKEAELGRLLSHDEQRALIAHFGHPVVMAARYWPQQYLIGPVLYPYYWPVVKIAIGLALAVHVVAAVVLLTAGAPWPDVGRAILRVWDAALAVFAWTTLAFWMVDRQVAGAGGFDKLTSAAVSGPGQDARHAAAHAAAHVAGRVEAEVDRVVRDVEQAVGGLAPISPIGQLVVHTVFTAWWLLAIKVPALMFGPAAAVIGFAPIWDRLFVPIAVLALLTLATKYGALARPDLKRRFDVVYTIIRCGALVVVYFILSAREWVVLAGTAVDGARFNVLIDIDDRQIPLIEFINYSIASVLVAVAVLYMIGIVRDLRRLLVRPRTHAAQSY